MAIQIQYTDKPLGHRIVGADVATLSDADFNRLQDTYDQYGVIVIDGQRITEDQQVAFSKRFGPLDRYVLERYNLKSHPEIFVVSNIIGDDGQPIGLGDAGRYWHTDMWVNPVPPRGSMLYALEVPHDDAGKPLGDTAFASTQAAYDALPVALRNAIEGRQALFTRKAYLDYRIADIGGADKLTAPEREGMEERAKNVIEQIAHPIVKPHPRTGRKCIYFSEGAIERIVGLPDNESQAILADLREHILKPEFVYRHQWAVGDIVMWDNTSCVHKAINDYAWPKHRRHMHRTTLANNPKVVLQ